MMEASFNAVSDMLCSPNEPHRWQSLAKSDKIIQFTSLLSHQRKDIRLGGVIALFLILDPAHELDEETATVICEEIYV